MLFRYLDVSFYEKVDAIERSNDLAQNRDESQSALQNSIALSSTANVTTSSML